MSRDIFVRIRDKLEESTARDAVKEFLKEIITWEVHSSEKVHPQYREAYEEIVKKHLRKEKGTAQ